MCYHAGMLSYILLCHTLTIAPGLIVIVFSTPVVGLGCSSGSYLIYGLSATLTWFFLVLSSWLYQVHGSSTRPRSSHRILANIFRRVGKLLAILSSLWVVVLSVLQFSNVLDNCWCNACAATRGKSLKSYIILFATNDTLANLAMSAWVSGVLWSAVTVFFMLTFVGVGKGSIKRVG